MKRIYYIGIAILILFEIANVYFIMPMPGSQRMDSLPLAYFLFQNRWIVRGVAGIMILFGLLPAFRSSRWLSLIALALGAFVFGMFNFYLSADHMFYQTRALTMAPAAENKVKPEKYVLGVALHEQARAYPVQFLGYHHQVIDTIGGMPVMVTYCTVCRSGRAYLPVVHGKTEQFRLVGMDHFNAMFEDAGTQSWWRQASGDAVAGPLKGESLPEISSTQTTLKKWLELYPNSLIMQADPSYREEYDSLDTYDIGLKRGKLTGTDTASWHDKSWVVGIDLDRRNAKAFDWNQLKKERIIQAEIAETPVVVVLASDQLSFSAFRRPAPADRFVWENDTLSLDGQKWDMKGNALTPGASNLQPLRAYQEFWHSWRSFHPYTSKY